ncbi:MAG: hypothetical protein ABH824_06965 [Nanoarchaeota archaeon]|nr:hypothetical protein [Nanoarchaeota archaeon]MBU1631943.1 hypothetical protein [Nanoarchaeota archaeon]MBU1875504.1 hypothetical protein [Nanoarchaeota archaeon]
MPAKKISGDELIQVVRTRVKYKDIFDMKAFYESLREWLKEYGWGDSDASERYEKYYGERIGQDGAKEIWIWWRLEKKASDTESFTYYLDFDYHLLQLLPAEVVKEGQKLKVNKGEVELFITAYMESKYLSSFRSNFILKAFTNLFTKRIYHKTIEERKKELYQETYVLQNFIKQWFKLKRYLPYEETKNFFPSYAWPSHLKE